MAMHGVRGLAQQGIHVALLRTMRVHLDEDPFRPTLDVDAGAHPVVHPRRRGRTGAAHVRGLDAGNQAEPPLTPVQTQRPLYDHQVTAGLATHPHQLAGVVRFRAQRIVGGVVDRVDHPRLRIARCRRQGEIGIAAQVTQQGQLVVDAAPATVGARVVQAPVAVDEAKAQLAGARIARQRAMALVQQLVEAVDGRVEVFGGIVVVMQVDFDLAKAVGAQAGELVEMFLDVLFLRIEEAVLRRAAIRIAMRAGQRAIVAAPAIHPRTLGGHVDPAPVRLEVVDKTEHHVDRPIDRWWPLPTQITAQPYLHVAGADRPAQQSRRPNQQQQYEKRQHDSPHQRVTSAGTSVSNCSALLRHWRSRAI